MLEVSVALVLALIAAGFSQRAALDLAGIARSTWHYRDRPRARVSEPVAHRQRRSKCWLDAGERARIEEKLRAGFTAKKSVYLAFYDALDAGDPVASLSTWYRIARGIDQTTRPIRRTRKHRATAMPTLLVDGPDQAWSWDITHLRGPYRGVTYQLYLAMDVFSRMVTGWRVETREDDDLATEMFQDAFKIRGVLPRIVHSDGGPSMTSRTLGDLFAELGIQASRNRPRVSNDNPYSESLFKTAKYTPDYPAFFTNLDHARSWAADFVEGYNHRHHHAGLEGHTPHDVHHGTWTGVHHRRQAAMDSLYTAHPERFTHPPRVPTPMAQVAINQETNRDRLHAG